MNPINSNKFPLRKISNTTLKPRKMKIKNQQKMSIQTGSSRLFWCTKFYLNRRNPCPYLRVELLSGLGSTKKSNIPIISSYEPLLFGTKSLISYFLFRRVFAVLGLGVPCNHDFGVAFQVRDTFFKWWRVECSWILQNALENRFSPSHSTSRFRSSYRQGRQFYFITVVTRYSECHGTEEKSSL